MTDTDYHNVSITTQEVAQTLNAIKGDSKCPFCNKEELLIDSFLDGPVFDEDTKERPIIGDTIKTNLVARPGEDSSEQWTYSKRQAATPMIRAVCQNCGCSLFFDYRIIAYKHSKLVEQNGDRSKNNS